MASLEFRKMAEQDKEYARLIANEPRVNWDAAPLRARITHGDARQIRLLSALGFVAIAAFRIWFFGEARVGVTLLYWPRTGCLPIQLLLSLC